MKKKKQKLKSRIIWGFSPVSRIVASKKIYSRKKYNNKNRENTWI